MGLCKDTEEGTFRGAMQRMEARESLAKREKNNMLLRKFVKKVEVFDNKLNKAKKLIDGFK